MLFRSTVVTDSPTDNANFDSVRGAVGGQLIATFDDVAGDVVQLVGEIEVKLEPGDVVACSAVGVPTAGDVTIAITSIGGTVREFILEGVTAEAGVLGLTA